MYKGDVYTHPLTHTYIGLKKGKNTIRQKEVFLKDLAYILGPEG